MIALLAAVVLQTQAQSPEAPRTFQPPPPGPEAVAADTGALHHASGRVAPVARAFRVDVAPRVDGRLDDPVWAAAEPITGLVQTEPREGDAASERTEVRIVYDDEAIYVGARLFDRAPGLIRGQLGRRDAYTASDAITIAFDSYHDHRTAFNFGVNAAGVKSDQLSSGDNSFGDDGWDPVWDVHTARDSLGWTAEMRIPFSQLRYATGGGQVWGINVVRWIQRSAENAVFAWKPRTDQGYTSYFGHLFGLERLPQPRRIEALPYATVRQERSPAAAGDRFNDGSRERGAAGVDLKLGVTSSLTLDATFNPDFGQVDQDPAFVNLSAYEQFLSERRPFFVEGSALFSFPRTQLFYSRRIGQPPHGFPDTPGDYQDVPASTTILGAAKLTGRSGPWSLGVVEAVTAREYAATWDTVTGRLYRDEVEPLTNYAVARARRDLRGGASQVGFIATATNRDLGDDGLTFLRRAAYVGGTDFTHRFGGNAWSLAGSFAYSWIGGDTTAIARAQRSSARYFQRPDAGHVEFDSSRTSLAGWTSQLDFRRIRGNWTWSVRGAATSPGFEVNDLGFQGRADQANLAASVTRRWTRPGRVFRQANLGWDLSSNWNFGGVRTSGFVGMWGWAQLPNYWSINASVSYNPPSLSDNLTRGGPLGFSASGRSFWLSVETDYRKRWEAWTGLSHNRNAIGAEYTGLYTSLSVRPTTAIRLQVGPEIDRSRTVQQFVASTPDTTAGATYGVRYVFGDIVQHSLNLTTRLDVTFSPSLSLQLFVQPFVATGEYRRYRELERPRAAAYLDYGRTPGSTLTPFCFDDAGAPVACDASGAPPPSYFEGDPDGAGPRPPVAFGNGDFTVRSLRANTVLRWEYRPGSTLFLVWTSSCGRFASLPRFRPLDDLGALCSGRSSNVFAVKFNYWLSL